MRIFKVMVCNCAPYKISWWNCCGPPSTTLWTISWLVWNPNILVANRNLVYRDFYGNTIFHFSFTILQILAVTEGYAVSRTLSSILEDLESVTAAYRAPRPGENSRSLFEKDLAASVDALTRLTDYNAASRTRPLSNNHDISNLVKTSSNLLELSNLPAWKTALKVIYKFKSLLISIIRNREKCLQNPFRTISFSQRSRSNGTEISCPWIK